MDHYVLPKSESWKMFNQISTSYDLLNHLLSFGLDIRWRKSLAKFLPKKNYVKIIDLATGTADVLISLCRRQKNIESAVGIDLADKMLEIGRKKIEKENLSKIITLKEGDAARILYADNAFDAATIAFGIRNVENPQIVLNEMHRVVREGGRALIMEFSLPNNLIFRVIHLFYLRAVVPILGGMISGHMHAYRYLNQTIETFPYGEEFCQMMERSGFKNVKANPLLFGVATIYQGDK